MVICGYIIFMSFDVFQLVTGDLTFTAFVLNQISFVYTRMQVVMCVKVATKFLNI